jgi:hypothetical protein
MSVSKVVATDLNDAMRGYLTHKTFIKSRWLEDRESFLKDPVMFDKLQDPVSGLIDFGAGLPSKE